MKFNVVVVLLSIGLSKVDAQAKISFDFVRQLLFPTDPELVRVRHAEDVLRDPFAVLDTAGLIEKHGYPAEEHNVTTDDGYHVTIFRIPGSPKSPPKKDKPVVYMQHGMLCSSDLWLLRGPGNDLAFLLADAGYDVWLGNLRGNTYGRSHTNLTTKDQEFWDFSVDDHGTTDLPNSIDYALANSGQTTFFYIGHSMGTTVSHMMLTQRSEYNDKMLLNVNLAPAVFFERPLGSFYPLLVDNINLVKATSAAFEAYDLGPQTRRMVTFARSSCNPGTATQPLCFAALTLISGKFNEGFNTSLLPDVLSYFPAGISTKTFLHMLQIIETDIFAAFDYGLAANLRIYGARKPTFYDVRKITTPNAIFWGETDALSHGEGSKKLAENLQNVVACEAVPARIFSHFDFLFSSRAKDLIYDRIMQLMSMHLKVDKN